MLDNVGLRYLHRASGAQAPRTLRPLPLLRVAVSATGGAHLCSIQYYLRFYDMARGMEAVPEGGERCFKCYRLRLQIGVNIVFSWFIDVSMKILQGFVPEEGAAQLLSLFIGCVILAFGISMEVAPNVLLVPGEGIVKALSKVCQKRFGTVKVIFDSSLISISFVLSFLFFHRLNGLGAGTVISALVVGKMVNICNHLPVIHKISAL